MTDKQLEEILKEKIQSGPCFNKMLQDILLRYKHAGGQQETARKMLEQLAVDFSSDEDLQNSVYDILDIVTGWCNLEMRVWDIKISEIAKDGIQIEDEDSGVIFNHFSFCELLKHTMVKYGKIDYDLANEKVTDSYLAKVPRTIGDVEFITHEVEFHWAMLLVHGHMYWTKGIPSDTNDFHNEYFEWRSEIKQKYNLKEPYIYYDK